jgi:hypothetical protein
MTRYVYGVHGGQRPGAGRPKGSTKPPEARKPATKAVSTRLTDVELAALDAYATTHGVSRAEAVAVLVRSLPHP